MRFGFNTVTAVSTTGFAAGAVDFAKQQGIELREVASLDPSEFKDWLHITEMRQTAGLRVLASQGEVPC